MRQRLGRFAQGLRNTCDCARDIYITNGEPKTNFATLVATPNGPPPHPRAPSLQTKGSPLDPAVEDPSAAGGGPGRARLGDLARGAGAGAFRGPHLRARACVRDGGRGSGLLAAWGRMGQNRFFQFSRSGHLPQPVRPAAAPQPQRRCGAPWGPCQPKTVFGFQGGSPPTVLGGLSSRCGAPWGPCQPKTVFHLHAPNPMGPPDLGCPGLPSTKELAPDSVAPSWVALSGVGPAVGCLLTMGPAPRRCSPKLTCLCGLCNQGACT